ncbi:MAG: hypothetical protein HY810_04430 [Candidatus Omnitrophica bacterium]|nr:hypothetical protein [Candidatus Omnitrophota bacterium]
MRKKLYLIIVGICFLSVIIGQNELFAQSLGDENNLTIPLQSELDLPLQAEEIKTCSNEIAIVRSTDSNKIDEKQVLYKAELEQEKIGVITGIKDNDEVIINIGEDKYVTVGMGFKVFRKQQRMELKELNESVVLKEHYIGEIKVINTEKDRAACNIVQEDATDKIGLNDKVVNIPGTGYAQLLEQKAIETAAVEIFRKGKTAARKGKAEAVSLFKEILTKFPQSAISNNAKEEIERYVRIENNSPYSLKNSYRFSAQGTTAGDSHDIVIDSKANIWILNAKKTLIEKFSSDGKLLLTLTAKNQYDLEVMKNPQKITCDTSDNLYILDAGLKKIVKLDNYGKFIKYIGSDDKADQVQNPVDIAVNSNGEVFILDSGNSRVHVFTGENMFCAIFGKFDDSDLQKSEPVAIDIDDQNNIYVLDKGTKYVHIFSKDFRFIKKLKVNNISDAVDLVVFFNAIFVLDKEKAYLKKYDKKTGAVIELALGSEKNESFISDPTALDLDNEGNVYIADGKNYSVLKSSNDGGLVAKFMNSGLMKPVGIAVSSLDTIYLLDKKLNHCQEFERNGWLLNTLELKAKSQSPCRITVDFDENIYVLDSKESIIYKYSKAGNYLASFGSKKIFKEAIDLCVGPEGNIYVLDAKDCEVKVLDCEGKHIRSFGEKIKRKKKETYGQFLRPVKIAASSKGIIIVLDEKNEQLYKFDLLDGKFISSIGNIDKKLKNPSNLSIDGIGFIYVSDSKDGKIIKIDDNGELLADIDLAQKKELKPKEITAFCVNGAGSIFVLDGSTCNVFEFIQ